MVWKYARGTQNLNKCSSVQLPVSKTKRKSPGEAPYHAKRKGRKPFQRPAASHACPFCWVRDPAREEGCQGPRYCPFRRAVWTAYALELYCRLAKSKTCESDHIPDLGSTKILLASTRSNVGGRTQYEKTQQRGAK